MIVTHLNEFDDGAAKCDAWNVNVNARIDGGLSHHRLHGGIRFLLLRSGKTCQMAEIGKRC